MQSYKATVIDGDLQQYLEDPCTETLSFDSLSWEDAVTLCRLATDQGFRCILSQQTEAGGGEDEAAGIYDLC